MKSKTLLRILITGALLLFLVFNTVIWFRRDSGLTAVRNVVLISIDTCRADYFGCYGYPLMTTPNIDAVAKTGVLFENAFSTVPLTLPAHSSMLTGTIPPYHGVHDNFDYQLDKSNITLAEILKKNGFATGAAVSTVVLDSKFDIDQGFDTYNDDFKDPIAGNVLEQREGDKTTAIALDWLDENKDKKFFYFLHYFDPHGIYEPPEPFASKFSSNLYAGEIAYVDACIGRVIKKLKDLDLYDSTLIIITSDHGEMLGEHGERTHGYFIYQGNMKVPLVLKLPSQSKPVRIKSIAGLVDIVPTVCGLLNIELPSTVHGIDLSAYFDGQNSTLTKRDLYCESLFPTKYNTNSLLGIVSSDHFKYIQTTRPELYDLAKDPAEADNVIDKQPQRARIMKDKLARILEQFVRKDSAGSKMEIDDQMRENLESLGYVGQAVTENLSFDQSKDDPKDMLDYHHLNMDAEFYITAVKDYGKAIELAQKMILLKPDSHYGYEKMGRTALKLKDYQKAVDFLNKAINIKPNEFKLYNEAAGAYKSLGKYDEAIRLWRKELELKPNNASVYHNIGMAFQAKGQIEEAAKHFRQAIAIAPDDSQSNFRLGNILTSQGKIDEAVKCYQTVLRKNPDMTDAHYNLGIINLSMRNQPKEAYTNFQNTLKYDRLSANDITNLAARFYAADPSAIDRADQTISLFELVIKSVPDCYMAYYNLGAILLKTGKTEEAYKNFRKAISLQPNNTMYLNNFAWMLATNPKSTPQDRQEAVKLTLRAVKLTGGKIARIVDTLAVAYAANGNFTKAIDIAEKALQLAAGNEELRKEINGRVERYKAKLPYTE
jgi:arylsulfatase A-like enzyme/Flp pilus assembly protein TadD